MNSHADDALGGGGDDLVPLVSELWCEALGLPEVNPSDNFFDLGGHSLLLHTVRNRLHERLGRDIPLVELFQYPTVRALADHLGGATAGDDPGAGGPSGALGGRLARLETGQGGRRTTRGAGTRAGQYGEEEEAW
ncbi:acyl carrier protein [Streptomyces sp. ISL-98]|uniref:acyl carrier protein n=1 Tax=Streptomyces sp. ISL-98 TaxID=2819192 RepID=UPI001BE57DEE|nr:acyl carrier protein [Streptomyces sp. ISL-98]MBT2507477.1 acyl carrier protein [Streptomyces sp. ISL-98]